MSELNGDKARFNRLRKQKIHRRERIRELREALEKQHQSKPSTMPRTRDSKRRAA